MHPLTRFARRMEKAAHWEEVSSPRSAVYATLLQAQSGASLLDMPRETHPNIRMLC